MTEDIPAWLEPLSHKDFLIDGRECDAETWARLDWSRAFVDMGPSPAGNPGPYFHVPLCGDAETVHRLYPKIVQTKWLGLIRETVWQAISIHIKLAREIAE
jgi:hypothetical protein